MKQKEVNSPINDLICNQYKTENRVFTWYRGFRLANVKMIVEYSFSGCVIKINQNNHEMRFDIYLRKELVDLKELEKFRKFWGKGFNVILLSEIGDIH